MLPCPPSPDVLLDQRMIRRDDQANPEESAGRLHDTLVYSQNPSILGMTSWDQSWDMTGTGACQQQTEGSSAAAYLIAGTTIDRIS